MEFKYHNINLKHKGFTGTVEYSDDDKLFFGKLVMFNNNNPINDLIFYHSETYGGLESSFKNAVDNYLDIKERINKG